MTGPAQPDQPQPESQPDEHQPESQPDQPDQPESDEAATTAEEPQAATTDTPAARDAEPSDPEATTPPEASADAQLAAAQPPPAQPPSASEQPTADDATPGEPPTGEQPTADDATPGEPPTGEQPTADDASAGEAPKDQQKAAEPKKGAEPKKAKKPKPEGPTVGQVVSRIGTTTEQALAYVRKPDPKLSRLSRKVREALLPDLPPATAGALLGPAALARHLVASAATGRYRDLFALWELFRSFPDECKPVLAERQAALGRARAKLHAATRIGISGQAARVAEDIERAEGLIWQWLREILGEMLPAVGARPQIAAALLRREADAPVPVPAVPDDRWLVEVAAARTDEPLPEPLERALAGNVHRLPATVETLRLATRHFPDRVAALVDRVDLDAPDVGAFLAWARDHNAADRLYGRIRDRISATAARDRARGLEVWHRWMERGVALPLPESLQVESLEGFDLSRPETAALAAQLLQRGVSLDLQAELEKLAARNRQLAEKAYEAMVCAGLDVTLPAALEDNPVVKDGTRCPNCQAWTWVRPGHEQRCPRPPAPPKQPEPDPFELAAAEVSRTQQP